MDGLWRSKGSLAGKYALEARPGTISNESYPKVEPDIIQFQLIIPTNVKLTFYHYFV